MEAQDVDYVMNMVKASATDYFSTNKSYDSTTFASKVIMKKGTKTEEHSSFFNETPPFISALLRSLTKALLEQNKTIIDQVKQEKDKEIAELKSELKAEIAELKSELRVCRNEVDALANYNRRENVKIEGVEFVDGEDTNEIVKEIGKYAGIEITDADISISHRLGSSNDDSTPPPPGLPKPQKRIPSIIFRASRRDIKNKLFEARKNVATNSNCPNKYKSVAIYEDVSPLRSRIMYELRQRGDKKEFRYVWSRGGRIFCRTPEEALMSKVPKPHIINKPEDLSTVGFSHEEIEAIIKNKRK